jgi:hypothetical protein
LDYIIPTTATQTTTQAESGSTTPLVVTIDEPFIVFGPSKDAVWLGTIKGGSTPYYIHIDWGDGKTTGYRITNVGSQSFRHHYTSMKPYDITLLVTDVTHRQVLLHFAAVTPYVPQRPVIVLGTSTPNSNGSLLGGLYGVYLLTLAAFGWFWVSTHPGPAYVKAPVPASPTPFRHRYGRAYGAAKRKRRQ